MKIIKEKNIQKSQVVKIFKNGGVVIFPSETVYGIGVDATNKKAVKSLVLYKQRPFGKPFSIAVSDQKMAEQYVFLNNTAINLYKEFLPGPLTVVSLGKHKVASGVESENGTLGVRIPNYKIIIDIIKGLGKPITATSANASYKKRPYQISDILNNISQKQKNIIDLIIDAGELPPNEPSTVIDTTMDDLVVLRQGKIKLKDEVSILSRNEESTKNTAKELWQKYEKYSGKRPIIFALEGPMGAGKTQFTKGLALAMGIKEEVVSPTFNLVLEYYSNLHLDSHCPLLTHIDSWRMQNPNELLTLGFNETVQNKNAVVAIEWAEKVVNVLRRYSEDSIIIWVKIAYGNKESERAISWGTL